MSQYFEVHPENPQQRLIRQAVQIIRDGGVVVYPTDSSYAIGCHLGNKSAMERIHRIRRVDKVDNMNYRLMKSLTPGPYTFIPRRKTIGLRIPEHIVTQAFLQELNEPVMSSTLILPGEELPMNDPYQIRVCLEHQVDLIIDSGFCSYEPTTVVDLMGERPEILREGKGPIDWLVEH